MQTLGLSDSEPRSENRLKSLFWPSIHTPTDVDYLGTQGYWVCAIVAALSFIFLLMSGQPIVGGAVLLFYYLGGVGVRERSLYAAGAVLVAFLSDTLMSPGIPRIFLLGLLFSNFRATWMASFWEPGSDQGVLPIRLGETLGDKFADKLPQWLWPKIRIPYYVFSVCYLVLTTVGLAIMIHRRHT